jgi:hypothetical protein
MCCLWVAIWLLWSVTIIRRNYMFSRVIVLLMSPAIIIHYLMFQHYLNSYFKRICVFICECILIAQTDKEINENSKWLIDDDQVSTIHVNIIEANF